MKKLLTILIVFFVGQTWAQTTDYLQQKDFKVEKQKIYEGINASKRQVNELKKINLKLEQSIDSLNRKLGYSDGQLGSAVDSLSKTSVKLNILQEKVDSQKFLSKGVRILIIAVLILLFVTLFAMLYLFRKRAGQNHQSLVDLDKKTNERIDQEMKNLKAEMQAFKATMDNNAGEMNQRISAGLNSIESKSHQMEQQVKDELGTIGGRIDIIGPEITRLREEQSGGFSDLAGQLKALKQELEHKNHELAARAVKLEEDIIKGKGKP